ncbi:MAG: MotA/TolQ/ExbB proton channel family protein [Deltaproteobacteria bacterium]|nr:MotA/TolQ/ExbB proton channel family protein [Deltaproteobacteria bacterium]
MTITQRLLALTLASGDWVLWLLLGLSVISLAIMVERGWRFSRHTVDVKALGAELRRLLAAGQLAEARRRLRRARTAAEAVVDAGLEEAERGVAAVGEAMIGAKALQRQRLERNLGFLATLGNNAPFVGLFGTVLGIIKAFHDLAGTQASARGAAVVMAGISEALVATAVGLFVAIPAVAAFNYFSRRVRAAMADTDALAHLVLSLLSRDEHDGLAEPSPTGQGGR